MSYSESLFSRLEKYSLAQKSSRENLFTEIFAYVLQRDPVLRREFLCLLGGKSLAKRFCNSEVKTQTLIHGNSYVDIAFIAAKGNLYIESKIDSCEGFRRLGREWHGQLNYYLRSIGANSCLAYITRSVAAEPEIDRRLKGHFIGHHHWDEIFLLLERRKRKTSFDLRNILEQTLLYMKECGMANPERFTKKELRQSDTVFAYLRKAKHLLSELWEAEAGLGNYLAARLGKSRRPFGVHQEPDNENMYVVYHSRKWPKRNHMGIYLFVYENSVDIGLGVWSRTATSRIADNLAIKRKVSEIKKAGSGFISEENERWWYIGRRYTLKAKDMDSLVKELLPRLKDTVAKLSSSRIIQMVGTRLSY